MKQFTGKKIDKIKLFKKIIYLTNCNFFFHILEQILKIELKTIYNLFFLFFIKIIFNLSWD